MNLRFRVVDGRQGRADKLVATHFPDVGRKQIAALFARGAVRVNGTIARKGDWIDAGSEIELSDIPHSDVRTPPTPAPELPLTVLYEDDHIVALDKPGGIPSHPLKRDDAGTLANALMARYPTCAEASQDAREGGLVHRLDIGTSGVLIAARTRTAWTNARHQFAQRSVHKVYWALVRLDSDAAHTHGRCDAPLLHRGARMQIAATEAIPGAQSASTSWRTVSRYPGNYRLLACTTHTGRMHQIRLHLAHSEAPIVGDTLYGGAPAPRPMTGFFLHARSVALAHPITGATLTIKAPLPVDRDQLLAYLSATDSVGPV